MSIVVSVQRTEDKEGDCGVVRFDRDSEHAQANSYISGDDICFDDLIPWGIHIFCQ